MLRVNGKADFVKQGAESYQRMAELADYDQSRQNIKQA